MNFMFKVFCTLLFNLVIIYGEGIKWDKENWAHSCDFYGKDFKILKEIEGELCGPTCGKDPQCTHFTWRPINGGTCFLKSGKISKEDAINVNDHSVVCGFIPEDTGIKWDKENWAHSCDFYGKDFKIIKEIEGELCGPTCGKDPQCTHFTWRPINGGTCFLKSGKISKEDAINVNDHSVVCGFIPVDTGINWDKENWAHSCDFYGKDFKILKRIEGELCGPICGKDPQCTHFTWRPINEGTCFLKSGKISKEDAINVNDHSVVCGFIPEKISKNEIKWNNDRAESCEFKNNDLKTVHVSREHCHEECEETRGCTHYSWSSLNYGTCFLKRGTIKKEAAILNEDLQRECGIVQKKYNNQASKLAERKFTVQFTLTPVDVGVETLCFETRYFKIFISDRKIWLDKSENFKQTVFKTPEYDLLHFKQDESTIWISLYALDGKNISNNFIKIGVGYTMTNNTLTQFTPQTDEANQILRNINSIKLQDDIFVIENTVYKEVVYQDFSVEVYDSDNIKFDDLNFNLFTQNDLPKEGLRLYQVVKSKGIDLSQEELDAINFSIEREGCSLNLKLKEKAKKSFGASNPKTSYLRVTFDYVDGSSPGQPYVVEIWPRGHFSPIHNHGNTVGLIKLIDGSLMSEYFNPLTEDNNLDQSPIKTVFLRGGQITWLSPTWYQTHRLTNINSTRAAISIQAYSHLDRLVKCHEETFNYILPGGGKLKRFYPTPDYSFDELIEITKTEKNQKTCNNPSKQSCCLYSGKVCGHFINKRSVSQGCTLSADPTSIYKCDKVTGKFELIESCTELCHQEYLSTRCKEKNRAVVRIKYGNWKNVSGYLTIEDYDENRIRINGVITGLKKNSHHGFHIHEFGEINEKCDSLGGHFNPFSSDKHGDIGNLFHEKHIGDLGNIKTDDKGTAKLEIYVDSYLINLEKSGPLSILNRGMAIHENQDDLGRGSHERSKVNGNSGPIIACGMILRNEK